MAVERFGGGAAETHEADGKRRKLGVGAVTVVAERVRDALVAATGMLADAGCETPQLDAEVLLADLLGADRARLVLDGDQSLAPADVERFRARVSRRAAREPVAYITGRRGFRWLELAVDPRVLIPRPETETLVEAVDLAHGRVHDLGTGSGAVALALKDEHPELVVTGSDRSAAAVTVARTNARRLGIDVAFAVHEGLPPGHYDMVVANLPYVADGDELAPEVRDWEPADALFAGADGLDALRRFVRDAPSGLRVALEHAPAQAAAVRALLTDARSVADLAGRERVTVGCCP